MIALIRGILLWKKNSMVVIETAGVGYEITISGTVEQALPQIGEQVTLYTYFFSGKDGAVGLFGFSSMEEKEIFLKLISVNGVGPKAALSFFSTMGTHTLITALVSSDVNTLCKVPGIGKKTAQRLVLELKDKFSEEFLLHMISGTEEEMPKAGGRVDAVLWEAVEALTALGYSRSESSKAVSAVYEEGKSTEELLKLALRRMLPY